MNKSFKKNLQLISSIRNEIINSMQRQITLDGFRLGGRMMYSTEDESIILVIEEFMQVIFFSMGKDDDIYLYKANLLMSERVRDVMHNTNNMVFSFKMNIISSYPA